MEKHNVTHRTDNDCIQNTERNPMQPQETNSLRSHCANELMNTALKLSSYKATNIYYLTVSLALSDPSSPTKQRVSGGAAVSSEGTSGEESLS